MCFFDNLWENTWYLQRFVAVHCGVHCRVHCACIVRALCKTRCLCSLLLSSAERCNAASGGVEAHSTLVHHARHTAYDLEFLPTCGAHAAMLLLCLWVAAVKMKVCLDWVFGKCKREFVQACVCTSINQKNYVPSSFWGSSFEDESVFGLRFCQMQKGICSSSCLHIHKPKNSPRVLQKKAAILLHVVTSHLIPPRPLDQCCCALHAGIRAEMVVPVFKAFPSKAM